MPKKKAGKTVVETRFDELCPWPYCQPYGEYQVTTIVKRKYTKRKPSIEKRLSLRPTPKQQQERRA